MHISLSEIDPKNRIYCNRSLNMRNIKAVGFDMDYTLALYKPEEFEVLAYQETLKKLVSAGYPETVLGFTFDITHMIRGLAIDKHRGNIIKLDRHRYVKVAYHGFKELTREERRSLYDASLAQSYEEPDYALIDTLFTLADAYLFAQLIDLRNKNPDKIRKTPLEIYRDVRHSIDLCHRDGSIKLKVAKNPGKYIKRDPLLKDTLERLRQSGRKIFVVTNSLWDYTHVVMNYIFGNDTQNLTLDWVQNFDVIVTGAAKPSFFMSPNPLYEVDPQSGLLRNTDGVLSPDSKIYQGGNFKQLHERLGISSGPEILYVGDHIYGDILRSKKELGWRTMLVINELEAELEALLKFKDEFKRYEELLQIKDDLDDEIQKLQLELEKTSTEATKGNASKSSTVQSLTQKRDSTREALRRSMRKYHQNFHGTWGQLMKTGHQNSRFAAQVENYACLYTSQLTNLLNYSPNFSFRSARDFMPHDFVHD
ncbi:MAG: HAD-IG family 5'-nucleotidase [Betaproteobacteria bacterium]|nr:HAD-IG family 5'-nucleotidase [Betaproteobacteria bacterium]